VPQDKKTGIGEEAPVRRLGPRKDRPNDSEGLIEEERKEKIGGGISRMHTDTMAESGNLGWERDGAGGQKKAPAAAKTQDARQLRVAQFGGGAERKEKARNSSVSAD